MSTTAAPAAARVQQLPARKFPTRTCVACRTERQKREFIRIVRSPDGTVMFDDTGRANGRGAYLCADGSCWQIALKKSAVERALGVSLPADVRQRLQAGMPVGEGVTHGT